MAVHVRVMTSLSLPHDPPVVTSDDETPGLSSQSSDAVAVPRAASVVTAEQSTVTEAGQVIVGFVVSKQEGGETRNERTNSFWTLHTPQSKEAESGGMSVSLASFRFCLFFYGQNASFLWSNLELHLILLSVR